MEATRTFATSRRRLRAHAFAAAASLLAFACGGTGEVRPDDEPLITGAGGGGGASSTTTASAGGFGPSGQGGGGAEDAKLGPPYPIVLAHGFFGFEEFAGLGFATYFFNTKSYLAEQGEFLVFTPSVDPFNDSDFRGAQLTEAIEGIVEMTGHRKVNIIGHSQGGLDARVVATLRPDLVASVVTLATPHEGTPIADIALKLTQNDDFAKVVDALVKLAGAPLYDKVGGTTSLAKPLWLLSKEGIAEFNAKYPDQPGILYASIGGRSGHHAGGDHCNPDIDVPFVSKFHKTLDPIDPLLAISEAVLDGGWGAPYPNDGLVRAIDSRRGEFWGCIPADHVDEVGHLLGDNPGQGNDWRHLPFYAEMIAYLRYRGF